MPKRKRRSGSKKGTPFERKLCKTLSKWWTGREGSSVFWRTANSGGRATVRGRVDQETAGHYGDICATCPDAAPLTDLLVLEAKKGRHGKGDGASAHGVLDNLSHHGPTVYERWFARAEEVVQQAGAFAWMLVHERDQKEALVFIPQRLYTALREAGLNSLPLPSLTLRYGEEGGYWHVVQGMKLSGFLGAVTPAMIRQVAKRN